MKDGNTTNTVSLFPALAGDDAYEAVVAACRAEMDAHGLSNTRASREMGRGVSHTVLSKWLRGIYEGDVPAVTARVAAWLETRRAAAERDLTPAGLDRHIALGVTEEIEGALSHAQSTGDIVVVHGRPGLGKSWAARRYCATRSAAYRLQATGAVKTLPGLLGRVGAAVGVGAEHPSALAAETAIVDWLEGRRALLVVDEAHHLGRVLLDELRCIRDEAGCGLALMGGDDLWTALARTPRCAQIVGRIGVRLGLGAPADADVLDLAAAVLSRHPKPGDAKALLATANGPGGLHALRRLLARAGDCEGRGARAHRRGRPRASGRRRGGGVIVTTHSLRLRFERDADALVLEEVYGPGDFPVARIGCRLPGDEDARALADALEYFVSTQEDAWFNEGWAAALALAEEDPDDEDD